MLTDCYRNCAKQTETRRHPPTRPPANPQVRHHFSPPANTRKTANDGFRSWCRKTCRFKSCRPHKLVTRGTSGSVGLGRKAKRRQRTDDWDESESDPDETVFAQGRQPHRTCASKSFVSTDLIHQTSAAEEALDIAARHAAPDPVGGHCTHALTRAARGHAERRVSGGCSTT